METLATRATDLFADAGDLAATELGELAGLNSPAHAGMILRGARPNISATTAVGIARVLGCTVEYLVEGLGARPTREAVRASVARARAVRDGTTDSHVAAPSSATSTQHDGTPTSNAA